MHYIGVVVLLICQLGGHSATGANLGSNNTLLTSGQPNGQKVVCYYTPTSYFPATRVPSDACTHLIYAFGSLSGASLNIAPPSGGVVGIWKTLTSLRRKNPQLKVMLSLQRGFPDVVGSNVQRMNKFAVNSVAYLHQYGFDGVDMDWEYPSGDQKAAYGTFFTLMRKAIEEDAKKSRKPALLLSLALPNNQYVARRSFDLPTIAREVDFATAMTYDFHVYNSKDTRTGYNSPVTAPPGESRYLSTSGMVNFYLKEAGFPGSKLLLGIPTYGRSWKLANAASHGLHAPAVGKGSPGPYRHLTGVYTYPDACVALQRGAQSVRDSQAGAVYLYHGTDWVAYDDQTTVKAKTHLARTSGLGGVGVWAMHIDDVSGVCKEGSLPLIRAMKAALLGKAQVPPSLSLLREPPQKGDSSQDHPLADMVHVPVPDTERESSVSRGVHEDLYYAVLQRELKVEFNNRAQLPAPGPGLTLLQRPRPREGVISMEKVDVLLEEWDASPSKPRN